MASDAKGSCKVASWRSFSRFASNPRGVALPFNAFELGGEEELLSCDVGVRNSEEITLFDGDPCEACCC